MFVISEQMAGLWIWPLSHRLGLIFLHWMPRPVVPVAQAGRFYKSLLPDSAPPNRFRACLH